MPATLLHLTVAMAGPATRGLRWQDLSQAEQEEAMDLQAAGLVFRRGDVLWPTAAGRAAAAEERVAMEQAPQTYEVEAYEEVHYAPAPTDTLLALLSVSEGVSVVELARALQLPYTTVYNQVQALIVLGEVEALPYRRRAGTVGRTPRRFRRA